MGHDAMDQAASAVVGGVWPVGRVAGASEGGGRSLDGQAHVDLTADEPDSALGDEPHQLHAHVASTQLHYVQLALCDLCLQRADQCQSLQYEGLYSTAQVR